MGKYHKRIQVEGSDAFELAVNITGKGAPTEDTEAEPGMVYMDEESANGDLYKCVRRTQTEEKVVYTWKKMPSQEEVDSLSKTIAELQKGGGTAVSAVEPADEDIPKVYITGALPTTKADGDVRVKIHYISKTDEFTYPATLKVQGGSSANYAKKNFTLKLYEDETYEKKVKREFKGWGKLNKFVLKAHWIDHSHVRNVGTAKIWGKIVKSRSDYDSLPEELLSAPNNGATDGFTCKVFANGVYQGLYEWIVPKDKLFGQDSDIATHSILNSEWNNQPTCAFATTSPRIDGNWSEELQDSMSSEISTSFANFIKFVAGATDEEFVANAENYFDVQSVIDFNIFARVFCIVDNLCRNQIFFTYDGVKWYEGCWDVDAVLGLPPTTRGFFAYNTDFQTGYIAYKDYGVTNMLYYRIENLFADRLKERYAELRSGVLSIENILEVYERLTDVITTYDGLLAEDFASTTGGGAFTGIPYTAQNNIQQIREFVSQRIPYMDGEVARLGTGTPCKGISLDKTELVFEGSGSQTITAIVIPENTTDEVVWKSDNVNVAVVDGGVVTTTGNGNTVITATCGLYYASCTVSVSNFGNYDPAEFEEVEYLTCDGNQYVLIEHECDKIGHGFGVSFKVDIEERASSYSPWIISDSANMCGMALREWSAMSALKGTETEVLNKNNGYTPIGEQEVYLNITENECTLNGTTKTVNSGAANASKKTICLLSHYASITANPSIRTYCLIGKMYGMKYYNGGEAIMDFVPAVRKSDNLAGLFDKIGSKFYTSNGDPFIYVKPAE